MNKVDEESKKAVRELLAEQLREVARKGDVITIDTPMPIKMTIKQVWGIVCFIAVVICSIVGGVWWLSQREHAFSEEIVSLRIEFKDEMVSLRSDMNNLMSALQDRKDSEFRALKDEVVALRATQPPGYPPPVWLEDVYRRDRDNHERRIQALEDKECE